MRIGEPRAAELLDKGPDRRQGLVLRVLNVDRLVKGGKGDIVPVAADLRQAEEVERLPGTVWVEVADDFFADLDGEASRHDGRLRGLDERTPSLKSFCRTQELLAKQENCREVDGSPLAAQS